MIDDLYDEYCDDEDGAVRFEKFRQRPKQGVKTDKRTKKDLVRERRREKAQDKEEASKQELHGVY